MKTLFTVLAIFVFSQVFSQSCPFKDKMIVPDVQKSMMGNPPILISTPPDMVIECGEIPTDEPVFQAGSSPISNIEYVISESGDICNRVYTQTWTAVDIMGLVTSTSRVLNSSDTTDPVFMGLDVSLNQFCDEAFPDPYNYVIEECSGVTIEISEAPFSGSCLGVIERTYTATDGCGNTGQAVQFFNILDDEFPEFIDIPNDTTINCGNIYPAEELMAIDNCDTDVAISFSETMGPSDCVSLMTRTWIAEDDCGNEISQTQIITILDNIAPEFTFFPEDFEGNCEDYVFSAAIAEDNCGDAIVDFTDDTISTNPTLEIIRTWIAIDPCGNLNEQIQSISKNDTEMPVVECPPIDTVFIVAGATYLMHDLIPLVNGSDNCTDDLIFTQSVAEGQALDLGENTVVVEAKDEFDNTGVCNTIVDVQISTSLQEFNDNLIRVFPNPVADFLVIEIDELKPNLSFSIFDSQGKLVQSNSLNTNRTSLGTSAYQSGLYHVALFDNGDLISRKSFVKD